MPNIVKIDDSTWRIEDEYVRFFLVCGDNKAALIDSGFSCKNAREIAMSLTQLPIMLINTHGDGDHTSGTASFSEVYMDSADYIEKDMKHLYPNTQLCELHDGDVIDLGGRTFEIISIPGHTKGSIAILDVEKRYLFAGDSVQSGHIYMFGSHREPDRFVSSLNRLINMSDRYDTVIASHDTPLLNSDYVAKVLESWKEVQSGKLPYENINLHGMDVKSYNAKYCGFYCE